MSQITPGPSTPSRSGEPPQVRDGIRLRLARLARGLSQQDLAAAAGVTRQAVAGFEAGRWDPSLRVAVALARALGTSVEDLFAAAAELPALDAVPLAPLPAGGARVEIGQVGTTAVAVPLSNHLPTRAGFMPCDGTTAPLAGRGTSHCAVTPLHAPRASLVVAGCDPALPLLRGPLSRLERPLGLLWWPCASDEALRLAAAGLVHVAGFHLDKAAAGDAPAMVRRLGVAEAEIVQFASWREGLAARPEQPVPTGLADVAHRSLRFVNREPGAEARRLVDQELQRLGIDACEIVGYDSAAEGHLVAASAVSARVGDVGITIEPAALAYGLSFVPLAEELSLLAIPRTHIALPEVQDLLRVLAAASVRDQLASLPGYHDVGTCGAPLMGA